MPFKFAYICDLLSKLESYELHDPPYLHTRKNELYRVATTTWFKQHSRSIHAPDVDQLALLSCLFPEHRVDRVYSIQEPRLVNLLARCLGMGHQRAAQLRSWNQTSRVDFGDHVERLQKEVDAGTSTSNTTVEQIDASLERLAAKGRFSSQQLTARHKHEATNRVGVLQPIVTFLPSRDLKWFIRILLKRLGSISLDEEVCFGSFHFLLPDILKFHSSLKDAMHMLQSPALAGFPPNPDPESRIFLRTLAAQRFQPKLGIKVGRPHFFKARSVKHCVSLLGIGLWSIESKYDGEYCQVHIDLSKGEDCVLLFSKSGKDSTHDRKALHAAIKNGLSIGSSDCKIQQKCILEGEMVVYSDKEEKILGFSKIRKHVSRSGVYLGNEVDSPAHRHEQLMIVYFDAMLIDNDVVMSRPLKERRQALKSIIKESPGRSMISKWEVFDAKVEPEDFLRRHMSIAIANRSEGLVLKPCDGPYISFARPEDGILQGCVIKLKKDYIPGLGDAADFAIIGASFIAAEAQQIGMPRLRWTSFHFACLKNKSEVSRYHTRPVFMVMGRISGASHCIAKKEAIELCKHAEANAWPFPGSDQLLDFDLALHYLDCEPEIVFREPYMAEILGSGFEKPPSRGYCMLRHARLSKLHMDRQPEDVVGFDELQEMAQKAMAVPEHMLEEEALWLHKLQESCIAQRSRYKENLSPFRSSMSSSPESFRTNTSVARSFRKPASLPMVRMDTSEMLPGDLRFVPASLNGSESYTTAAESLHTPQSQIRDLQRKYKQAPLAGSSQINGQKRRAEALASLNLSQHKRSKHSLFSSSEAEASRGQLTNIETSQQTLSPISSAKQTSETTKSLETSNITYVNFVTAPESGQGEKACCTHLLSLQNCVFYTCPSLGNMVPFINIVLDHHVLEGGDVFRIDDLVHWRRDIDETLGSDASIIQESQAFQGATKAVLVGISMKAEVKETIAELLKLKLAKQEKVVIWSWRVLEILISNLGTYTAAEQRLIRRVCLNGLDWDFSDHKQGTDVPSQLVDQTVGVVEFDHRTGQNVFRCGTGRRFVELGNREIASCSSSAGQVVELGVTTSFNPQ